MRGCLKCVVVLLCSLFLLAGPVRAEEMSGKDVVSLKKLGFSDAEIKSAVEKAGTKLKFTDAELAELKTAGAGDELIKALKESGPKELPLSVLVEMVKAGKSPEQVLDAMVAAPTIYTLSPTDAIKLAKEGVPAPVVLAIKGKPLGVSELKLLAEGKASPALYTKLSAMLGYAKTELSPAEALAMVKAGMPAEVVASLKAGKPATTIQPPTASDLNEYTHAGHYFTIRYPKTWNLVRDVEDGEVRFSVSPEAGKKRSKDLDTLFSVSMLVVDPNSAFAGKDAIAVLKNLIPLYRANEPDIIPQGEPVMDKLGSLPAARLAVKGKPKERTGIFRGNIYVAIDHGIIFFASAATAEGQYASYEETLNRIVAQSDFGRTLISTRTPGPPQEANEIVNRYKESVVCVMCDLGGGNRSAGTGFVIQKDGYLATNAHVALDLDHAGKQAVKYEAIFDADTGRKSLPLTFVGARRASSSNGLHGVDVALFKLPPGDYTPLPLTEARDVRLSDPVVTMGFPKTFDFRTTNMFTTGGVVTRFNRELDGKIESLYIDAKITHGNSGGPCIDRATGGVIGLNTFGRDIAVGSGREIKDNNDLVGYSGVVPAEVLMAEFPVQAELGLDPESSSLDFIDCYSLARIYVEQGRYRAAVELARQAVKLQPRSADAHALVGMCDLRAVDPSTLSVGDFKPTRELGVASLNKALEIEADHENSCLVLSNVFAGQGDMVKATQYSDRAVKAHPDHFIVHLQQARLYELLNRYDEALASAKKAKELARDIQADAYILTGNILYTQGKLDEGKAEFVRAGEIHPTNLEARLGIGQYYELKKNYESAIVEYGRVNSDLPDTPRVMTCMGRCLYQLKRYDDAIEQFQNCENRARDLGQVPPMECYTTAGAIYSDVMHKPELAASVYFRALVYYGHFHNSADIYLRMAKIFKDLNFPGIAFSHLCRAISVDPENAEATRQLKARELPKMSKDDILALLKNNVALSVVVDMVKSTPLNFGPKTDADIKTLIDENLPEPVIIAVIDSNKAYPATVNTEGTNPNPNLNPNANPNPNPNPKLGPVAHPELLVGTWSATVRGNNQSAVLSITFEKNGRYSSRIAPQFGQALVDRGQWLVNGNQIIDKSDTGSTEALPFQLEGDTLTVEIDSLGKVALKRQ